MASIRCDGEEIITTESIEYKKEFSWKLENWQDWWRSMEINELIFSQTFILEAEGTVHQFKLAMLKYNSYESIVDSIDVMLRLSLYYIGPSNQIILKPSFYIPVGGLGTGHTFEASRMKKSGFSRSWVWSEHWFNCYMNDILDDGSLTFGCLAKINIFKRNPGLIDLENNLCSNKSWNYCLSEKFDFISDTKNYYSFSDFVIICNGEGIKKSFNCHRIILSLGSAYFKTMLSGDFCESQCSRVEVPDISSGTMAELLQYLYTGELDPTKVDIELLSTAHKYQVKGLHAISELELAKNLTVDTAPQLAVAADLYGSKEFKRYVFRFVTKYWKQVNVNDRYEWIERNPALLSQILSTG